MEISLFILLFIISCICGYFKIFPSISVIIGVLSFLWIWIQIYLTFFHVCVGDSVYCSSQWWYVFPIVIITFPIMFFGGCVLIFALLFQFLIYIEKKFFKK